MDEPALIATLVIDVFEKLRIPYFIGGSVASAACLDLSWPAKHCGCRLPISLN